jgi:hypothetical protein
MIRYLMTMAVTLLLALGGCQRQAEGPFELQGHIFVFNYRLAYASYLVTFRKVGVVPDGMRYVATFENPAGGEPLVVERKIFAAQEKLAIESPHVNCIRKNRPYSIRVEFFDSGTRPVLKIETTVTSDLDDTILPEKPLVSGPAYEPNKDARDASGQIINRSNHNCPA